MLSVASIRAEFQAPKASHLSTSKRFRRPEFLQLRPWCAWPDLVCSLVKLPFMCYGQIVPLKAEI